MLPKCSKMINKGPTFRHFDRSSVAQECCSLCSSNMEYFMPTQKASGFKMKSRKHSFSAAEPLHWLGGHNWELNWNVDHSVSKVLPIVPRFCSAFVWNSNISSSGFDSWLTSDSVQSSKSDKHNHIFLSRGSAAKVHQISRFVLQ